MDRIRTLVEKWCNDNKQFLILWGLLATIGSPKLAALLLVGAWAGGITETAMKMKLIVGEGLLTLGEIYTSVDTTTSTTTTTPLLRGFITGLVMIIAVVEIVKLSSSKKKYVQDVRDQIEKEIDHLNAKQANVKKLKEQTCSRIAKFLGLCSGTDNSGWFSQRKDTIHIVSKPIEGLISSRRTSDQVQFVCSVQGLMGGLATVAGGVLTIASHGLLAPAMAAAGAIASVAAGATSVGTYLVETISNKLVTEEVKTAIKMDQNISNDLVYCLKEIEIKTEELIMLIEDMERMREHIQCMLERLEDSGFKEIRNVALKASQNGFGLADSTVIKKMGNLEENHLKNVQALKRVLEFSVDVKNLCITQKLSASNPALKATIFLSAVGTVFDFIQILETKKSIENGSPSELADKLEEIVLKLQAEEKEVENLHQEFTRMLNETGYNEAQKPIKCEK